MAAGCDQWGHAYGNDRLFAGELCRQRAHGRALRLVRPQPKYHCTQRDRSPIPSCKRWPRFSTMGDLTSGDFTKLSGSGYGLQLC